MGSTRGTKTTGSGTAASAEGAELRQTNTNGHAPDVARSVVISRQGVRTGEDFANLMSALMSDIIEERISPNVANAAVNAGGKLLKVVEMQYRYGKPEQPSVKALTLATGA